MRHLLSFNSYYMKAATAQQLNLKKTIALGFFWNIVQLVINQSFAFVLKLVLAKLLFPDQFGLVGMATVFTGFVQVLNDLGIGAALVQRNKDQLREAHFSTAFWTGVVWSVLLYILMSLGVAPLAAWFYQEPKLTVIIPVLSLGILASPINLVHKAQLTRDMNFKKQALITNVSNIVAGVIAIVLAFYGAGIWALVFNSVAIILIAVPMYFKATGWRPSLSFEKKAFKDVFGFGMYTTGSNIMNYLYNNIDYLLIGKMMGASVLGWYTLAFVLTDTFRGRLLTMVNNVMYPLYGQKQNDIVELKKFYTKTVLFNCLLVFPVMVFFIACGHSFIISVFGEKWQGTVLPLQILSAAVIIHTLCGGNTTLLRGLGRPGLEMKQQVLKAVIFVPTLAFAIRAYGITGAAWAVLLNKVIVFAIAQYTMSYLVPVKISFAELISALRAPIQAASIMLIVACFLNIWQLHYLLNALLSTGVYLVVLWLIMGAELKSLLAAVKKS